MPQFLELLPRQEALKIFIDHLPSLNQKKEQIKTIDSMGRILSEDIVSSEYSPPFTRSTVDGYAVHAADTFGAGDSMPIYIPVTGEVSMGEPAGFSLKAGTVCLIHTGGMLPEGSDAVVMLEDTQPARPGEIEIFKAVAAGENIIMTGEDVTPGQVVLTAGIRIGPAEIGGLLALGILTVTTAKPPLVGILSSGDEIIPPECQPQAGQIRDINSYSLKALVQRYGGEARLFGIAPDELHAFEQILKNAFAQCDMLLVTAGSSASIRDLTSTAIQQLGKPGILVHGVRIRPGKPTILAVCDGKPVIGLPGNPVSALVIASLFAIPVLEYISGKTSLTPRSVISARLTLNVPSTAGREDFIPVHLFIEQDGYRAEPVFFKSNMIFSLAKSNGIMRIPADAVGLSAGEMVEVYLSL